MHSELVIIHCISSKTKWQTFILEKWIDVQVASEAGGEQGFVGMAKNVQTSMVTRWFLSKAHYGKITLGKIADSHGQVVRMGVLWSSLETSSHSGGGPEVHREMALKGRLAKLKSCMFFGFFFFFFPQWAKHCDSIS